MTVQEVQLGNGVSRVASVDDVLDDYSQGEVYGYAAARRGQPVNPTIHRMTKAFRVGYLDGYDSYAYDSCRYHRLDMLDDGSD